VKPGDILVGKVTPKGETQSLPKRNCCAPFSVKSRRRKGCVALLPAGIEGPSSIARFLAQGQEKDERSKSIEETQIQRLQRNLTDEIRILTDERAKRLGCCLKARSC